MQTSALILGALALTQIEATPDRLDTSGCQEDWSDTWVNLNNQMGNANGDALTFQNSPGSIGSPIHVDVNFQNWYTNQVIYFKVTTTGGRYHAVKVMPDLDNGGANAWADMGTLEGGQARTTVGDAVTCRYGKAAQTIYKWTPASSPSDDSEDIHLEIIAMAGKGLPVAYLQLTATGGQTTATTTLSPSGATSVTDGLSEPSNLACKTDFTTDGITAAAGADTASGGQITFTCSANSGGDARVASGKATCNNGLWDSPTCGVANAACATAFSTEFITADVGAATAHGAEVTFTCTSSRLASGKAMCTNGNWNKPTCVKAASPCLENFYTSDISALVGAGTAHGASVTFACAGSKVPSDKATCTDGQWNAPNCGGDDPDNQDSASAASLGFLALAASVLAFSL